jgi:hypothetical protein
MHALRAATPRDLQCGGDARVNNTAAKTLRAARECSEANGVKQVRCVR